MKGGFRKLRSQFQVREEDEYWDYVPKCMTVMLIGNVGHPCSTLGNLDKEQKQSETNLPYGMCNAYIELRREGVQIGHRCKVLRNSVKNVKNDRNAYLSVT